MTPTDRPGGVRLARAGWRIAAGTGVGLALWMGAMRVFGRVEQMFYYPDRNVYGSPADLGLRFDDVWFNSDDRTRLHGWFVYAAVEPVGTVVHFHGNAQNLTAHFGYVDWLPRRGFHVFAFDYRGYGRSEGTPNRAGLAADCRAALREVRRHPKVDPDRIVGFGQSLGAANLLAILGRDGASGLRAAVADSAFFSYRSIVRDKIADMPLLSFLRAPLSRMAIDDEWSPGPVVARIAPLPLLFLHGERDRVIPAAHSRRLFEAAAEPKTLWLIPKRDHCEAIADDRGPWRDRLTAFFLAAIDGPPPAAKAAR